MWLYLDSCLSWPLPGSHKHKHRRKQHHLHQHEQHRHGYHQFGTQAPPPAFSQFPNQPGQQSSAIYSQDPSMQVLYCTVLYGYMLRVVPALIVSFSSNVVIQRLLSWLLHEHWQVLRNQLELVWTGLQQAETSLAWNKLKQASPEKPVHPDRNVGKAYFNQFQAV